MTIIKESNVRFGPFTDEQLFYIEKSNIYKSLGDGFKTVEFIYAYKEQSKIYFLEAKTNIPNGENRFIDEKHFVSYEKFYDDLSQKIKDSFSILISALLGRFEDVDEIGDNIRNKDLKRVKFVFVIVVTNPQADFAWLPQPKAEMEERLLKLRKVWNVDVLFMNQSMALGKKIIVDHTL